MRRLAEWFFRAIDPPARPGRVIAWWEIRRIPFNVVVGAYGFLCLLLFFRVIGTSGHLEPGEDPVEPIALLAAPLVINILYTLGWLVEVPVRLLRPGLSPRFGVLLLQAGLGLGLLIITIPAAVWLGIRALQVLGVVR